MILYFLMDLWMLYHDYRMDRQSFWHLHDLIKHDAVFISTGRRPQRPVKYQLATFLCRVGSDSAVKTAAVISIAEGSVYQYMDRVCKALRHIRNDHLSWPGNLRRTYISDAMEKSGFPGCLGAADGTYIQLADKPLQNPYAFWCWKKFYALCPTCLYIWSDCF